MKTVSNYHNNEIKLTFSSPTNTADLWCITFFANETKKCHRYTFPVSLPIKYLHVTLLTFVGCGAKIQRKIMYNYGISTWGVKTVHHNRPDTAAPSPAILSNLLGTSARSTDFVLVYENAPWSDLAKCAQVHNFVSSLQDSGLIVSSFQAEVRVIFNFRPP